MSQNKSSLPRLNVTEAQKVQVLNTILHLNNELFGDKATKAVRNMGWAKVLEKSHTFGAMFKDIKHVSGLVNNWKKALKLKTMKSGQTGEGGQPELSEAEQILSEIVYGSRRRRQLQV
jgi:hypothetical protein